MAIHHLIEIEYSEFESESSSALSPLPTSAGLENALPLSNIPGIVPPLLLAPHGILALVHA